ncbi:MAG: LPXTG cell wall anchor domain-containing protein [Oscillospiraceae bacterium]|jgi:LPXTG-motif cell wall-anchored protein|nr:LPXTG cell wall anchor domain-containing protein [Oscillospiraceae bacterium]
MKKAIALVMALALALSFSVLSFAEDTAKVAADAKQAVQDFLATIDPDTANKAVSDALLKVVPAGFDLDGGDLAAVLTESDVKLFGDDIISSLNLGGTDIAAKIQEAMSGDFVSFLAGLYTGGVTPEPETTSAATVVSSETTPVETKPTTGSSSTIAIAAFAALSLMAGAAFVCAKKKEA